MCVSSAPLWRSFWLVALCASPLPVSHRVAPCCFVFRPLFQTFSGPPKKSRVNFRTIRLTLPNAPHYLLLPSYLPTYLPTDFITHLPANQPNYPPTHLNNSHTRRNSIHCILREREQCCGTRSSPSEQRNVACAPAKILHVPCIFATTLPVCVHVFRVVSWARSRQV